MISILLVFLNGAAADVAKLRVMLDPGHGGRDLGAAVGDARESVVTLDVARRLADLLRVDPAFAVKLTRGGDEKMALTERTKRAHEWRADLFVSIHANASDDPRAHGAEFYFQNQRAGDEASAFLAHRENEFETGEFDHRAAPRPAVLDRLDRESATIVGDLLDGARVLGSSKLVKAIGLSWTGPRKSILDSIRQAPFFVLSEINVPSALVELGFLTNPTDARRLNAVDGRRAMARDLYRGLRRYARERDSRPTE